MNSFWQFLELLFSRKFQAYLFTAMFGFFAIAAFIGGFWNPSQFAACALFLVLLLFALVELENLRK